MAVMLARPSRLPPAPARARNTRPAGPVEIAVILAALFFYLFADCVASAVMVIAARILSIPCCSDPGLRQWGRPFLLARRRVSGLILIVVYVGAVAVLFLFVVMMLDVDFAELRQGS